MRQRFAPSPSGLLHIGHAYSALNIWKQTQQNAGTYLLRIEDIDRLRCKPQFTAAIFNDLSWLDIRYDKNILYQHQRHTAYKDCLNQLWQRGYLYACSCTRKDIQIASAPQEGSRHIIYPGFCKNRRRRQSIPTKMALRLDLTQVRRQKFSFIETGPRAEQQSGRIDFTLSDVQKTIGDVVLARRDIGVSYHLAVVLDDAYQNITHVTRGQDLFQSTKVHVVLQHILGLPVPIYHHHKLIRDEAFKRLAKRDKARSLHSYRQAGYRAQAIKSLLGF